MQSTFYIIVLSEGMSVTHLYIQYWRQFKKHHMEFLFFLFYAPCKVINDDKGILGTIKNH